MARELVHIGFGNFLSPDRIAESHVPTSAPVQRLIRQAKQAGTVIDITSGRRTKTAVILDTGHIVLLAISPDTLAGRLKGTRRGDSRARASAR